MLLLSPSADPSPVGVPTAEEILGRAGGENFPVATLLVGARYRQRLVAIYGWSRLIDQLGDDYAGDRLAALRWAEEELTRALAGDRVAHPLIASVAGFVAETDADPQLLRDLIEANRRDQATTAYATWSELAGYCRFSANPVGRLVLSAFGATSPERVAWSDDVCTALQLVEHTQDVVEDAAAGRTYVPAEDLARFSVDAAALAGPGPASADLRALVAFECARARRLLDAGRPLTRSLRGRARVAVTGFVAGGRAAIDALVAADFDPLGGAPTVRPSRLAVRALTLVGGR